MTKTTKDILRDAKKCSSEIATLSSDKRNSALLEMAKSLISHTDDILSANNVDVESSKDRLGPIMVDRLRLTKERIEAMAKGLLDLLHLPDPLEKTYSEVIRPNGLVIKKVAVPIGVVAIIYESRPNVTSDAASLAIKSGNVCVLRTGKDAFNSASAIVSALREGLKNSGISENAIQLIQDKSHDSANEIMRANGLVDLLIPRGGHNLIKSCIENATVPCIQTGTGICHIFVDESANLNMALDIVNNAKTSRPSVCNAVEVCLVHKNIADKFLPLLKKKLVDDRIAHGKVPVELRCDKYAFSLINTKEVSPLDFDTEFLDYILAIKTVENVSEAIEHISLHSTGHSEAIISNDTYNVELFTKAIDSSSVYVNASTRFTDGGEFGLGCEMGISTQKLHARGPMGLEELTTYKYVIIGNGQVR